MCCDEGKGERGIVRELIKKNKKKYGFGLYNNNNNKCSSNPGNNDNKPYKPNYVEKTL